MVANRRRLLLPRDVRALAIEYDAAPDLPIDAEGAALCRALWEEYRAFSLDRQAELADDFNILLVNLEMPYNNGRELLADLVAGTYKVPAPHACPVHPEWDGVGYAASRTWHDIDGHGYGGAYFDLEGELVTVRMQAEVLREAGREHLVCVVFSDTMQQLCSTLYNHRFAPQKVVLTEHEKLIERVLNG